MPDPAKVILISILSFGRPQNVVNQLNSLPEWLHSFALASNIHCHIVVRNNDPKADFAEVAALMHAVEAGYPTLRCSLITGVPNTGFGAGHNSNIASAAGDYALILNDDIGFPHINWLGEAVNLLDTDARTVCVGADENPKHINPFFGNGLLPGAFHLMTLQYAEASVLLFNRAAFDRLGGFSADYRWAMCEDSDLSLRVQQNGLRIAHLSMPHEHWRSTSFNSLPGTVKSSILEHNRAALFANWGETLTAGRIGRFEVFDIWSDGIGDVFCALPHMLERLAQSPIGQRRNIVVNTSHPELFGWLELDGARVMSVRDLAELRAALAQEGLATLRSMRDINFSLPFNIHPLVAGALGVDQAGPATMARFGAMLRGLPLPQVGISLVPGSYCVVHLEFSRNHEGRALAVGASAALLRQCGMVFDRIVVVGRERHLSGALFGGAADIVDLQGVLSLSQLAAVVANARYFVGLDSFPAHVAQAAGVASAVFFGAVHPLARVWDPATTWPLTAALDCIGCYHTHLEPSVPFCMRRDVACTTDIDAGAMQAVLAAMVAGGAFGWGDLQLGWQALQARLIKLARFHPAPPERLFRSHLVANEEMSNLMYKVTEQVGALLRGHYHTSTVQALAAQAAELQAEIYTTRVALDAAQKLHGAGSFMMAAKPPYATQIIQLSSLALVAQRCRVQIADQWIEAEAYDDDPQISLPLLRGGGGNVQLRLSSVTGANDALQVYWAVNDAAFSPERVHTMPSAGGMQTAHLIFDIAADDTLQIRIDPCTQAGRARLRGSLGGVFALLDAAAGSDAAAVFAASGQIWPPAPMAIAPVAPLAPTVAPDRAPDLTRTWPEDGGKIVAREYDGGGLPEATAADARPTGAAPHRARRRARDKAHVT
jgi:GT2 family glycosyltransferase